jgi:hypothetical protein
MGLYRGGVSYRGGDEGVRWGWGEVELRGWDNLWVEDGQDIAVMKNYPRSVAGTEFLTRG